jgi:hypothetical protein
LRREIRWGITIFFETESYVQNSNYAFDFSLSRLLSFIFRNVR